MKLEFMFMKHYVPNRCEPRIEVIVQMRVWPGRGKGNQEFVIVKMQKKQPGGGCQGGCERRIEVIVKMQKSVGVQWGLGSGWGCQGGYEPRISYCENEKKIGWGFRGGAGGGLLGVRSGGGGSGWMCTKN